MADKLKLTDVIAKRMDWLTRRQQVLSTNIANSDTPDYTPQDLKDTHFKALVSRKSKAMEPAATQAGHISTNPLRGAHFNAVEDKDVYETAPTGNSVVLEEQMIKMSQTQLDYQSMVRLYRKHQAMYKSVLKGPN